MEYGTRASGDWTFTRERESVTVTPSLRLATDAAAIAVGACHAALGLLHVPELAVHHQLESGSLARVLPDWSLPEADVWAVYGHRTSDDPTLGLLIDELRRAFERLGGTPGSRAPGPRRAIGEP